MAAKGPIQQDRTVPVSTMRAVIAKRMVESTTTIPYIYLDIEIDAEPLLEQTAVSTQACEQLESATRTVSDPVTGDSDDDRDVDDRTGGGAAVCGCQHGADVRGLGVLALGVRHRRRRR